MYIALRLACATPAESFKLNNNWKISTKMRTSERKESFCKDMLVSFRLFILVNQLNFFKDFFFKFHYTFSANHEIKHRNNNNTFRRTATKAQLFL